MATACSSRSSLSDASGVTSLLLTGSAVRGSVNLGTDSTVVRFAPRSVTLPRTQDTVITRYLRAVLTRLDLRIRDRAARWP